MSWNVAEVVMHRDQRRRLKGAAPAHRLGSNHAPKHDSVQASSMSLLRDSNYGHNLTWHSAVVHLAWTLPS